MNDYLKKLKEEEPFDRNMVFEKMEPYYPNLTESNFKKKFQKLLDEKTLVRVGRNAYSVCEDGQMLYSHEYSQLSNEIAEKLMDEYPLLNFCIFESIQLNLFVNHQIAHNAVYLSIENALGNFVFDELRQRYPGKVLLQPSVKVFQQYWQDNMIIIEKMPSEAPKGKTVFWHTELEKMLVDIMADKLVKQSVIKSEYPVIYEEAFEHYIIDESKMFRYAKRRTADEKILDFLNENTNVKLKTRTRRQG